MCFHYDKGQIWTRTLELAPLFVFLSNPSDLPAASNTQCFDWFPFLLLFSADLRCCFICVFGPFVLCWAKKTKAKTQQIQKYFAIKTKILIGRWREEKNKRLSECHFVTSSFPLVITIMERIDYSKCWLTVIVIKRRLSCIQMCQCNLSLSGCDSHGNNKV